MIVYFQFDNMRLQTGISRLWEKPSASAADFWQSICFNPLNINISIYWFPLSVSCNAPVKSIAIFSNGHPMLHYFINALSYCCGPLLEAQTAHLVGSHHIHNLLGCYATYFFHSLCYSSCPPSMPSWSCGNASACFQEAFQYSVIIPLWL